MRRLLCGNPAHRRGRTGRRGSALLEAALVLAVLAPLAVMAGRYAWGVYQVDTLHTMVDAAARFGATAPLGAGEEAWKQAVRRQAICGKPGPCASGRLPGLRESNIRVELVREPGAPPMVEVAVEGFTLPTPAGDRTFHGKPSARFPYTGVAAAMKNQPDQ